jgi:hypothetical protein
VEIHLALARLESIARTKKGDLSKAEGVESEKKKNGNDLSESPRVTKLLGNARIFYANMKPNKLRYGGVRMRQE